VKVLGNEAVNRDLSMSGAKAVRSPLRSEVLGVLAPFQVSKPSRHWTLRNVDFVIAAYVLRKQSNY